MNKIDQRSNREEWLEHVSAWRQGGLTQSAYCRLHGLVLGTFNSWVGRVKKTSVESTMPLKLVPVVVESASDGSSLSLPLSLQHASGWHLHLPTGAPASWLGKVLKELA